MNMDNMLLRTYAEFAGAREARRALLAAGFAPDCISFTAKEDEAGPVAGSFVIDREQHSASLRKTSNFSDGYDPNGVQNTRPVDWGSSYMLMVEAQDAAQLQLATEITERFGGVDIEPMIRPRDQS